MANTSSAKKAVRSAQNKKAANDAVRENLRITRKELQKAITAGKKPADMVESLSRYYKQVDKAAKKTVNVLSKNKAARMKSSMTKKVNASAA